MSSSGIAGLDVSKWQGDVDFAAAAASGKAFVYCRACYGTGADSRIGDYWPKAKAAGLMRGAYHFLVAGEDGDAQAQAFLKVFQGAGMGYGPGDLPPAADVEDQNALASDAATAAYVAALKTWVTTVGQALGVTPAIYTGTWFWGPWATCRASRTARCGSRAMGRRRATCRRAGPAGPSGSTAATAPAPASRVPSTSTSSMATGRHWRPWRSRRGRRRSARPHRRFDRQGGAPSCKPWRV